MRAPPIPACNLNLQPLLVADQAAGYGGANIDPNTAATLHQQWTKALGGSYKIASPAVARGGKAWMTVSLILSPTRSRIPPFAWSLPDS